MPAKKSLPPPPSAPRTRFDGSDLPGVPAPPLPPALRPDVFGNRPVMGAPVMPEPMALYQLGSGLLTKLDTATHMGQPGVLGAPMIPKPNALPSAATATTRLYRVDSPKAAQRGVPEWMQGSEQYEAIKNATGRWFAQDPAELPFYLKDSDPGATIKHVDVPTKDLESFRVSNQPSIGRFSARPDKEFFLPKEIAEKRQLTHPDDLPAEIRNQYLPTGPDGKLVYPEGMRPRGTK